LLIVRVTISLGRPANRRDRTVHAGELGVGLVHHDDPAIGLRHGVVGGLDGRQWQGVAGRIVRAAQEQHVRAVLLDGRHDALGGEQQTRTGLRDECRACCVAYEFVHRVTRGETQRHPSRTAEGLQ
jgi:hypothetical protein